MDRDSVERNLVKNDILECLSDNPYKKECEPVDLNRILSRLKQVIEEIEGNVNREIDELLKQMSVVLCNEKLSENEEQINKKPEIIRQDTFVITRDENRIGDGPSQVTVSTAIPPAHHLCQKLTEAFGKMDLKEKVIVVLLEPEHESGRCENLILE